MTFSQGENPLAHKKLSSLVIDHLHTQPLISNDLCCDSPDKKANAKKKLTAPVTNQDSEATGSENEASNSVTHNLNASYLHSCDFEVFRLALEATSRVEDFQMICNLSRKVLGQTGDGHFCPVGGYNAEAGMVLLLDTARFKYPPHWVNLNLLYQSVCTSDSESGIMRGFILLTRKTNHMKRNKQKATKLRQSTLLSVDMSQAYESHFGQSVHEIGPVHDICSLLDFLYSNDRVKVNLFIYMYQLTDWFGSSEYCPCEQVEDYRGYLSCCKTYRNQIQGFLHKTTGIVPKLASLLL